jgi:SPP1 gp7 family putative phage head morphogenesis protein
MQGLVDKMTNLVNSSSSLWEMTSKLDTFANSKALSMASSDIATKMVTMIANEKEVNWRAAARKSSMGKYIYKALYRTVRSDNKVEYKTIIDNNALLIKTLPYDLAKQTALKAAKLATEGKRASEIAKIIQKDFPEYSKAKAGLIARTEVSKASTAVTQVQSKKFGFNWYVWKTSKDARVRGSHDHMDGVLINWNDPPAPEILNKQPTEGKYHAGNIYNCRCYPEPIVDLGLIKWPHKVYHNGKIEMMTRVKFEALNVTPKQQPVQTKPKPVVQPVKSLEQDLKDQLIANQVAQAAVQAATATKQQAQQLKDKQLLDASVEYPADDFKEIQLYRAAQLANKHTAHIKREQKYVDAINWYTSSDGYDNMNKYVRNGKSAWASDTIRTEKSVRDAIQAYEDQPPVATEKAMLYRGTGYSFIDNMLKGNKDAESISEKIQRDFTDLKDLKRIDEDAYNRFKQTFKQKLNIMFAGKVYREDAFTSTSYERFAYAAGKHVQLKIQTDPSVAEAMVITNISRYGSTEAEVLFNVGMIYKIEDMDIEETMHGVRLVPRITVLGHDKELQQKYL